MLVNVLGFDDMWLVLNLALYYFVLVFFFVFFFLFFFFLCFYFSSFSIAITSLGEEIVNVCAFRTFARFARIWFCLFPLPLGVWEGLRLVIVVLPGLFSYLLLPRLPII